MDWITGLLTIWAMELVARKNWRGWLVGIFNQSLWLWLIFERKLWGLFPLTVVLSWRYAAALLRWRRETASEDVE